MIEETDVTRNVFRNYFVGDVLEFLGPPNQQSWIFLRKCFEGVFDHPSENL